MGVTVSPTQGQRMVELGELGTVTYGPMGEASDEGAGGGGTACTTPNRGQTTWLGSWSRAWIEEESPGKFCISVQGDPLPGPPDNRLKDDFLNSLKTIGLDFL